jgi:prolyl oligopeptidase
MRSLLLAAALALATPALAQPYPITRKADVVDEHFGVQVSDPYRWMEEAGSREVADWVSAQNELTNRYLEGLPLRRQFHKRITELWDYPKTQVPQVENGRLFYRRNSGLQLQAPLYVRSGLSGPPALVLDPNSLSPDGTVALADFKPSPDARLLAYAMAEGGADWRTIRVREVASGRDLHDEVRWVRFSWISWTRDSKGFFYSRYPEPPEGKALAAELSGQALYYHRLGTPQDEDILVYQRPDLPKWFIGGWVTEDGRYLVLRVSPAAGPINRLYYADLGNARRPNVRAAVKPLVEVDGRDFWVLGNEGPNLLVRTDDGASNRKIVGIDVRDPRRAAWKTIVPEAKHAIRFSDYIAGRIVLEYLEDAETRLALFDSAGRARGGIALPESGSILALSGRQSSGRIYYEFSSPLYRNTVFAYDPGSGRSAAFEPPPPAADAARYETRRLFAASKDGTRIPFFLTARKDLARDGANPTLLLGYGGFAISLRPSYRAQAIAWLEQGGVWVSAGIRGGGEYGDAWYQAARAEKRQTGFDDFIAVAEHLVKEKYTSPRKLGIVGGSNGGLLVTAVSQQRPELYAVVLASVPVTDMLRFDRFTGGRAWINEYGSPHNRAQFKHLLRISPVHNVKPGTCYPATLVTTADHDDRVVPSHSYKFTAALQAVQTCKPALLRVEAKGSHGYRATDRLIAELADVMAFAAEHTGMRGH